MLVNTRKNMNNVLITYVAQLKLFTSSAVFYAIHSSIIFMPAIEILLKYDNGIYTHMSIPANKVTAVNMKNILPILHYKTIVGMPQPFSYDNLKPGC